LHLLPSMLKMPGISARDIASNYRALWASMRLRDEDVRTLDSIDARTFLARLGVSQRFIEWFWASASMAIMNVPLEHCSAGALMRLFSFLIARNGYRFGFATTGLSELFVPAARKLIESARGRVLMNAGAKSFCTARGAMDSVVLVDGTRLRARFFVIAIPPEDLQRLLPDECAGALRELDGLSRFVPSPYVSSYIWFARKLTRERFWARVFSPSNLNYDSYDLSNIRTGWGHRPSVIASNIIYSHRAHGMSDQQIIEATLRELSEFVPDAMSTPIRHAVVNRIPMAIPCPHPGVEQIRPRSATSLRGLYLAGDWTRTGLPCSMESAVCSGSLAAEQIWREIGRPRSIARRMCPPQGIAALVHGLPRWRSAVARAAQ
jgi:protoporphyrinogen oxidase